MKLLHEFTTMAAMMVLGIGLSAVPVSAQDQQPQRQPGQGRGNFDPEQMRQRMMDRYREQMEVPDDAEWKLISERIAKVAELRISNSGMGAMFGGRGGARSGDGGGDGGGRRWGGGNPESDALRAALEAKAPAQEIKNLLAKLREARKANEAKLEAAQEELKKVLNVRQEAVAVMNGLLR
ncbi:MAG: hypothetical protein FJ404_05300 [Verrucomicrobia bacterium]|nr:hypothetical protein [Verrucomicrobiota bacterium]